MYLLCPKCGSKSIKRNGYTRHGKQNHRCFDCGRQFSLDTICFASEECSAEPEESAIASQFALACPQVL